MTLKTFLEALRLYRRTFLVVVAVVLVAGLGWLWLTPTTYVSTTQLMVSIEGSTTAAAYENDQVVAGRVNTYIALLTSAVVNQRVVDTLGLDESATELASRVSATAVPPKTAIIDVAVSDESPTQAKLLADTLAREFIGYADAVETPTAQDGQKVHTRVITAASQPHERRAERLALAALVALSAVVLGAVAVWGRARTDPVLRTSDQAARASGLPILGPVCSGPADSAEAFEGYRLLRIRLHSMAERSDPDDEQGRIWVITSTVGEIDTPTVASNLGRAMQLAGGRSTVLDTHAPVNAGSEPAPEPEPAEVSAGGLPDTLSVSTWVHDPDLATTDAVGLLAQLRNEYAHVLVAAPPVLKAITASVVSESADGVLLVIALGTTRRRDLGDAVATLRTMGAPLTCAVLSETSDQH